MQIFKNPNYDFVKYRWPALIVSWVIISVGLVVMFTKGLPLGVEFSGGTIVIVEFDKVPGIQQVRDAAGREFGEARLAQALADARGLPAEELVSTMLSELDRWRPRGVPAQDDVTLVVIDVLRET